MPAPEGLGRAGTLLWRAGEVASFSVYNDLPTPLTGGEPLTVGDADGELKPFNGTRGYAVAVFAEGQVLHPGARGVRAVIFAGNVVRVKTAGPVARGSMVAGTTGGFVQVQDPAHPTTYSASEADAIERASRSISGVALDEAPGPGYEIRVVLR